MDESRLGDCPNCGEGISSAGKLIEYRRDDGSRAVYADCGSCGEVVHPV